MNTSHRRPILLQLLTDGLPLLADENIEQATIHYLRKLRHDVVWVGEIPALGLGIDDESIAAFAATNNRLIITQDTDFFTQISVGQTAGVLFQRDQTLSARTVGDIVHEISQYIDQSAVTLEYLSKNWLR